MGAWLSRELREADEVLDAAAKQKKLAEDTKRSRPPLDSAQHTPPTAAYRVLKKDPRSPGNEDVQRTPIEVESTPARKNRKGSTVTVDSNISDSSNGSGVVAAGECLQRSVLRDNFENQLKTQSRKCDTDK